MVFSGLVTACRLATWPTKRSPLLVNPTTDGVVRPPSWFGITTGCPPSMTETTELVVPKSIPMILLICLVPLVVDFALNFSQFDLAQHHYAILVQRCQVSLGTNYSRARGGRRLGSSRS